MNKHLHVIKELEKIMDECHFESKTFNKRYPSDFCITVDCREEYPRASIFTMPNIETIYYISKVPSNSSLCYCHPKKASCLSLNSVDVLQIGSDTVIDLEPINLLEDNSDKLFQMSTLFPNFIVESWAVISHLRFGDSDIEGLVISDISDEHYNNVLELLEQAKGDIHE
ncbi:hypothetical protein BZF66_06110 [Salmonella enterica]|nr:hypothetical protein CPT_Munch_070 [Salmonella phage Munch]EAZ2022868.1 hypothetical protein [Salmonella enterica]ECV9084002.1 hypothetical protein [Salmonella enterica subsp. enterica serovar Infantis]MCP0435898.1 hypothetical protein [Salmonella enterica subsp. enterica serovar Mbandaka]EHX8550319.1 hypothetical protein [Salmonella enterica]